MKTRFLDTIPTYKDCKIIDETSLGEGAFGEVKKCEGDQYVLKTALPHETSDGEIKQIMFKGEYEYMFDPSYNDKKKFEFVVKMYPVKKEKTPGCYDMFKVVMEKVTPLDEFLKEKEAKSQIRYNIAIKLIELVEALHNELNYSHNDLKPENIGIRTIKTTGQNSAQQHLVLLDMGTSMKFNEQDKDMWFHIDNTNMKLYEKITPFTLEYANPGIYGEFYHNHIHRDNWALACTVYKIFTGESIYGDRTAPQITKKIFTFNEETLTQFIYDNLLKTDNINNNKIAEKINELMLPSITVYKQRASGGGKKCRMNKYRIKKGGVATNKDEIVIDEERKYHYSFYKNKTDEANDKNKTIIIHNIDEWKKLVQNSGVDNLIFKNTSTETASETSAETFAETFAKKNRFQIQDDDTTQQGVHSAGKLIKPSITKTKITREQYHKYKNSKSKVYTVKKYRIKDLTNKKENTYVYYKYKN